MTRLLIDWRQFMVALVIGVAGCATTPTFSTYQSSPTAAIGQTASSDGITVNGGSDTR